MFMSTLGKTSPVSFFMVDFYTIHTKDYILTEIY